MTSPTVRGATPAAHPQLTVAPAPELARIFATRCAEQATRAIEARGTFTVAIPGGSVAMTFLPALARAAIDWDLVHVFFGDERLVPADDPESNFGLAQRLLGHDTVRRATLHPMWPDDSVPSDAADRYARELEQIAGNPPVLDLVLLGVGEDGHVCSLFSGLPALAERTRMVVVVANAPKPPPDRVTLTLPVIQAARSVCVAAFGTAKAEAMATALEDGTAATPVAQALRGSRHVWVLLDPDAAAHLKHSA